MPTEIIAAIVSALVTGIFTLIAYLYNQRRGNRVIVKKLSQSRQISISDSVHQKLEINFDKKKIQTLVLTQFVIFNSGNKNIKPLKLIVRVKPKKDNFTFIEVNVNDPVEITTFKIDGLTGTFEVERPHLNKKRGYPEEEIRLSVFSDVSLDFSVTGGGEDWDSKLVDYSKEQEIKIYYLSIGTIAFFFILGLIIFYCVPKTFVGFDLIGTIIGSVITLVTLFLIVYSFIKFTIRLLNW